MYDNFTCTEQHHAKHKYINTHVVELKRLAQVVVARIICWGRGGLFSVIHCVYGVVYICRGGSAGKGQGCWFAKNRGANSESDFLASYRKCVRVLHSRKRYLPLKDAV